MKSKRPRSPKQVAHTKALRAICVGRKHTAEARAKMRVAWRSRASASPETRAKMSAAGKGNKKALGSRHSPEVRAKKSAAMMGNQNMLGYKHTPEARAKITAALKGPNNPAWLGGVSREPYAWTFNAELKEEVRRRDDYRCQLCGVPQAECGSTLNVHHGDYDKKNSDPVNLVSLCPCCHSKTNTNRTHWTAVFQAMAIKRSIAELEGRQ